MSQDMTNARLLQLIKAGRSAIEYRILGVILRPREMIDNDYQKIDGLHALLKNYNQLMSEFEQQHSIRDAANDADGGNIESI
jgi:hypothetical protein